MGDLAIIQMILVRVSLIQRQFGIIFLNLPPPSSVCGWVKWCGDAANLLQPFCRNLQRRFRCGARLQGSETRIAALG